MTPKQQQELVAIANNYSNLQCIECALALKNYLILSAIKGKIIKISTGADLDYRNCFLYDDSIGGDAISETGYHEGVIVIKDGVEIVFDNLNPQGIPKQNG